MCDSIASQLCPVRIGYRSGAAMGDRRGWGNERALGAALVTCPLLHFFSPLCISFILEATWGM